MDGQVDVSHAAGPIRIGVTSDVPVSVRVADVPLAVRVLGMPGPPGDPGDPGAPGEQGAPGEPGGFDSNAVFDGGNF